ncbi:response regulator transcription factor [Actinomadura graeca]|uniref:Response regulator transcription factor n=1 Tax=Actinomadura graeca TaxID=2750812 RepID=A0ABX8QUG3_9ACTN|nr:response regulator transcription factor [Actinomadura graeca]QXJ22465.1 response regulator transcription factor [Actinomadura graeca]
MKKSGLREALRLLVVDSHPIVYAGVSSAAATTQWLMVVGYVRTGQEAVTAVKSHRPDAVLLDLRLPDPLAVKVIQDVRANAPGIKVIIFCARARVDAAVVDSADGLVPKDADPAYLLEVLDRVARGEDVARTAPAKDRTALVRDLRKHGLTDREFEILRRVAMGETNAEIARVTGLASNTVKTYFQRTLEKLGARNRVEAVVHAAEIGLL